MKTYKERFVIGLLVAIVLTIIYFISGCKKSGNRCYECEVVCNGVHHFEDKCGDPTTFQFKDATGQDCSFACRKKP